MRFLFLALLFSCSSPELRKEQVQKPLDNPEVYLKKCEENHDSLACARYGHLTKKIEYTKKACYMGHQNSCFNLEQYENRAPQQNLAIISSHQGMIFGCYANHTLDKEERGEKEIYLTFVINTFGKLVDLSVSGEKLSQKFKDCVISSFSSRKFMPLERDQNIRYGIVLPSVKKSDYRGTGGLIIDQ
jgi:hypothetical protein